MSCANASTIAANAKKGAKCPLGNPATVSRSISQTKLRCATWARCWKSERHDKGRHQPPSPNEGSRLPSRDAAPPSHVLGCPDHLARRKGCHRHRELVLLIRAWLECVPVRPTRFIAGWNRIICRAAMAHRTSCHTGDPKWRMHRL